MGPEGRAPSRPGVGWSWHSRLQETVALRPHLRNAAPDPTVAFGGTRSVASGEGGTRPSGVVHDRRYRSRSGPQGSVALRRVRSGRRLPYPGLLRSILRNARLEKMRVPRPNEATRDRFFPPGRPALSISLQDVPPLPSAPRPNRKRASRGPTPETAEGRRSLRYFRDAVNQEWPKCLIHLQKHKVGRTVGERVRGFGRDPCRRPLRPYRVSRRIRRHVADSLQFCIDTRPVREARGVPSAARSGDRRTIVSSGPIGRTCRPRRRSVAFALSERTRSLPPQGSGSLPPRSHRSTELRRGPVGVRKTVLVPVSLLPGRGLLGQTAADLEEGGAEGPSFILDRSAVSRYVRHASVFAVGRRRCGMIARRWAVEPLFRCDGQRLGQFYPNRLGRFVVPLLAALGAGFFPGVQSAHALSVTRFLSNDNHVYWLSRRPRPLLR
ncbi:MAG: hypothetical protein KatS3mg076_2188 [Candidatus Binatia bacterium]|nr:MAG: hypothetical protein KatS3mg076_2188 [Candidatus Binatia bacterium]